MGKQDQDDLVGAFEDEQTETEVEVTDEEPVEEGTKEKKKAKPVELLDVDGVREDGDGNSLHPKYLEYIELLGGWKGMSEIDKRKINATFKKPGRAFGTGVDVSKLPPAHRKALDLNKLIRDAAYAGVENNAMDTFNELQALNPDGKVSVEVYFKGWKVFIAGLPEEE